MFSDGSYCDMLFPPDGDNNCISLLVNFSNAGMSWINSGYNSDSCAALTAAADAYVAADCDTTGTGIGNYISTVFTSDSCEYYADASSAVMTAQPIFIRSDFNELHKRLKSFQSKAIYRKMIRWRD